VFFLDDFPLNALPRLTHYGSASLDGRHGVENDCHFGYEFVYVEAGSANLVLNEFEAPLCIAGEDLIITAPFVKRRLMKPAASFETSVMEHVESCLRLNFAKGVSLDELAKMSGYHPAYLCRKFKEKKGLPPRAHLNEYRIRAWPRLRHSAVSATPPISATSSSGRPGSPQAPTLRPSRPKGREGGKRVPHRVGADLVRRPAFAISTCAPVIPCHSR